MFLWNALIAQTWQGRVMDLITSQPLPYVNIGVAGKNMGTVSKNDGSFEINVSQALVGDTVQFSMIGYSSKKYSLTPKVSCSGMVVAMEPDSLILPEVFVQASSTVLYEKVGHVEATRTTTGHSGYDWKGTEVGTPILGINSRKIGQFAMHLRYHLYDSVLFRLRIYDWVDGRPGEQLLQQNIYLISKKREDWTVVDLRPYNIFPKKDVLVSIEPIKTYGKQSGLFFSHSPKTSDTKSYIRQSSMAPWEIYINNPFAFYLTVEK